MGAGSRSFRSISAVLPISLGWRVAFGFGAVLGLGVLVLRKAMPESPRWLLMHGYLNEAANIMDQIEIDALGASPTRPSVSESRWSSPARFGCAKS